MVRFITLVAGIVVVTLVAVGGIVTVALMSGGGDRGASTVATIIGFCATITASMLAILRAELNAQEIRAARDAVDRKLEQTHTSVKEIERRVNGNLETAIDKAVAAERSQLIAATAMPKTADELEALLHRAVQLALGQLSAATPGGSTEGGEQGIPPGRAAAEGNATAEGGRAE
jgi:formiminotetrahydrofolate cyclodeaminase